MSGLQPSGPDNAYDQVAVSDFRRIFPLLSGIGLFIHALFFVSDAAFIPHFETRHVMLRLTAVVHLIILIILNRHLNSIRRIKWTMLVAAAVQAWPVTFLLLDGAGTIPSYNQGLDLIALALLIAFPSSLAHSISIVVVIYAPFYVANLLLLNQTPVAHTLLNLVHSVGVMTIAGFVVQQRQAIRQSELTAKESLKRELTDRQAVIDSQVALVSKAKIAATIASSTQMLAHDIRKPFRTMAAGLKLIEGGVDPDYVVETARRLIPEVKRSMEAVEGMLSDIVEIDSRGMLQPSPISVRSLIDASIAEVARFKGANLDIRMHHDSESIAICVDELKMQRVLVNLLENASDAAGESGTIWVTVERETVELKPMVQFTIGNTGSFVPDTEWERVFEAFYTKGKRKGTGLGLAIARKIVEAHGGRISCRSDAQKGTEFIFLLPAYVANSASGDAAAIVEDDVFVRELWARSLSGGAKVHQFNDPEEFLAAVAKDDGLLASLTCIVTDYHFSPQGDSPMTGLSLARRIKGIHSVPVVLCSDMVVTPEERAQFDLVLAKDPISWPALKRQVDRKNNPYPSATSTRLPDLCRLPKSLINQRLVNAGEAPRLCRANEVQKWASAQKGRWPLSF